jgi:hypothetical protein
LPNNKTGLLNHSLQICRKRRKFRRFLSERLATISEGMIK